MSAICNDPINRAYETAALLAIERARQAIAEQQSRQSNVARLLLDRQAQNAVSLVCPACTGHGVSMPRCKEDCQQCKGTGRQTVEVTLAELAAALRLAGSTTEG
jgi:hypothetical protein